MGYSAQSIGVWQNWTPTFTGFSSDPSGPTARYTLNGKMCTINLATGSGTSNATTFTITLPFTAKYQISTMTCVGVDNGGGVYSYIRTNAGSNIADCFKSITTTTWTASGTKRISAEFTYEIE